jgi:serine/threonine protein kinase
MTPDSNAEELTIAPSGLGPDAVPETAPQQAHAVAPEPEVNDLQQIGGYRVLKRLGAGGMGMVYAGEDPVLQRQVAIKVMLPSLRASKSGRERFLHEARAAAAVEHDHIVPIYQVGEEEGVPFFAMPLLRGESLEDRLKRDGRVPLTELLRIGRETAEGLAAAHERGLIHRDIKPANIWLESVLRSPSSVRHPSPSARPKPLVAGVDGGPSTGDYRVKILDFGVVLAMTGEADAGRPEPTVPAADAIHQAPPTRRVTIAGTPAYMAPEQVNLDSVDHRCDLFSLGCVLYRLATGRMPFSGEDTVQTLCAVCSNAPRPPRELNPDLPSSLNDLILRLLAKHPTDRIQSAQDVASALAKLESDLHSARPRWRRLFDAYLLVLLLFVVAVVVLIVRKNASESVLKTTDPHLEVVVDKSGSLLRLQDPESNQTWELDPAKYQIEMLDQTGSLKLDVPGRGTLTLRRNRNGELEVTGSGGQ